MTKVLALLSLLLLLPANTLAQDRDLVPLFPREANVDVDGTGLARLPLPGEVLEGARGDLADLRLFDDTHTPAREVPFLVDSGTRPVEPELPPLEIVDARAVSLATNQSARVGLPAIAREAYVITTPDHDSPAGAWDLVVVTASPRFVRRIEVRDDVIGTGRLAAGTVFRLPSPAQEHVRIRVAGRLPPMIGVTLEGEAGYLEPAFRFEAVRPREVAETFELPLTEIGRRRTDDGRTIVELTRPSGIVPSRLRVDTDTPAFDRPVRIRDGGAQGGDRVLAHTNILRVSDLGVDVRDFPILDARGDRFFVEIGDGDSPVLERIAVFAIVERPALVFHAAGPLVLRFGGGRAQAPGYDLARLGGTPLGRRVIGEVTREAMLGTIRDNPRFDPAPALQFAMRPGNALDPRRSTHQRELRADAAPEGLTKLRLVADDLAAARQDLGDVRVVDGDNRQWPYLLERTAVTVEHPVVLATPQRLHETDDGTRRSRYALRLPATPIAASELALSPREPFVDRHYRVIGRIELPERRRARARPGEDEVILGEGRLLRRPGDTTPIRVPLRATRVLDLTLEIHDGDDAPLTFESTTGTPAVLTLPSADLYLVAPPGTYRLLLGDPDAPAAHYEITRARDLILAVGAAPLRPITDLVPNPRHVARATGALTTTLLWIAIILAVLILAFLTLRLVRQSDTPPAPPAAPPPEPTPVEPPA